MDINLEVLKKIYEEMNIMIRTKKNIPEKGWTDKYRFLERKRDRYIKKLSPPVGNPMNGIIQR